MGDKIFIILGFFVFFLVVEFVMMGAFQAVGSIKTKRVLRTLCQAFLAILIVGYLLLVGMSLFTGAVPALDRKGAGVAACAGAAAAGTGAGTEPHLGRHGAVKKACPGDLKEPFGQAIITTENREKIY